MRMYDIIKRKRDGYVLTDEEIDFFVKGYVDGTIPDYQVSALLMAIFQRDMSYEETLKLTFAIRDSGEVLTFPTVRDIITDKHSTGGVGDGTSLVVAPIVASCGVKVAMISGRGLGHTGGTLDKLESISGYRTKISPNEFESMVYRIGVSLAGQSDNMAPADKKLYALRDVTATVDKIPLIASSIMGKKLAEGCDALVLDVKTGSGAFMKSYSEAQLLANTLFKIAEDSGKRAVALVTNMDEPLGNTVGNSLEVVQAIATMKNDGPADFTYLCVELAAYMLYLAGKGDLDECRGMAKKSLKDGSALKKFKEIVAEHGGDVKMIDRPKLLPKSKYSMKIKSVRSGYIIHQDAERYGVAACVLGAGRNTMDDVIDHGAGLVLFKKAGDKVKAGEVIAVAYSGDESKMEEAKEIILSSTVVGDEKPNLKPLVLKRIAR